MYFLLFILKLESFSLSDQKAINKEEFSRISSLSVPQMKEKMYLLFTLHY